MPPLTCRYGPDVSTDHVMPWPPPADDWTGEGKLFMNCATRPLRQTHTHRRDAESVAQDPYRGMGEAFMMLLPLERG